MTLNNCLQGHPNVPSIDLKYMLRVVTLLSSHSDSPLGQSNKIAQRELCPQRKSPQFLHHRTNSTRDKINDLQVCSANNKVSYTCIKDEGSQAKPSAIKVLESRV